MEVHQDYKELLELFKGNHVEYVIVGGYAMVYHGAPRTTKDIADLEDLGASKSAPSSSSLCFPPNTISFLHYFLGFFL